MNGIDSDGFDHRQKNRRQNQNRRRAFHKHAHDRQHQDNQDENQIRIAGNAQHDFRNLLGHFVDRHAVTKQRRHRNDEHNRADVPRRISKRLNESFPIQFLVDEHADKRRIYTGKSANLRGRKQTRADAHQQNDREEQRPEALFERFPHFARLRFFGSGRLVSANCGDQPCREHHHQHHEQADDQSRGKEFADGDVARRAVNDHGVSGRNRRRNQSGKGNVAGNESLGIARFLHVAAQKARFHGRVRNSRAGNAAHHRGQHDTGLRIAAAHASGQNARELGKPVRRSAAVQQVARKDEQRHRQKRKILRLRQRHLHHDGRRKVAVLHKEQRARNAYRKSNRHADNQENDKRDENNQHDPYHLNF